MSRPKKGRRVEGTPRVFLFAPMDRTPQGEVILPLDEWEALRLSDGLGLPQEEAAAHMGVSRQTFGRLLNRARAKTAKALVQGLSIKIAPEVYPEGTTFLCRDCGYTWSPSFPLSFPVHCPHCNGSGVFREGGGWGNTR